MTGAALAVALVLAGAQTQQLVQTVEKFAFTDLSHDNFMHRWFGRALGGFAGQVAGKVFNLSVKRSSTSDATASADDAQPGDEKSEDNTASDSDDDDADDTLHVNVTVNGGKGSGASASPVAPQAPASPDAPAAPGGHGSNAARRAQHASIATTNADGSARAVTVTDGPARAVTLSEHVRGAATVELLHDIASAAGWSLTLESVGQARIDADFDDLEPAEALRQVLLKASCMGVLRGDRLVVIAAGVNGHSAGLLVEKRPDDERSRSRTNPHSADLWKIGGDVVIPAGAVVQGDVLAVLGSVDVEPGAVVQGNVAAIGGSVNVQQGAVVMEDSIAVFGENLEHGGKILGDHVQVDFAPPVSGAPKHHRGFLSRIGPFGLFPTLALFAIVYLVGLLALRLWPERMRAMGGILVESPLRAFVIGFLCWLLFFPVLVLLAVSVVGILLIPLVPLAVGISVMVGGCALALRIGEALPAAEGQRFVPPAALAMGLTTMLLVSLVPWVGAPLLMLVLFVAPGAVISSRFGRSLPSP